MIIPELLNIAEINFHFIRMGGGGVLLLELKTIFQLMLYIFFSCGGKCTVLNEVLYLSISITFQREIVLFYSTTLI